MDWEPKIKDGGYLPERGQPTEETVCYKIGGTYYEVSTSCDGSERLRDEMRFSLGAIWHSRSESAVINS